MTHAVILQGRDEIVIDLQMLNAGQNEYVVTRQSKIAIPQSTLECIVRLKAVLPFVSQPANPPPRGKCVWYMP